MAISSAAAATADGSTAGCTMSRGTAGATGADWVSTFQGVATTAGPGRPSRAARIARARTCLASDGCSTLSADLTKLRSVVNWSGIS
ncbi:Uncharacterised protein [Mycobacteroides abscessus subsp. abscessus]|nr:Uncharacterised protein [Mycobacteroides abscessus subsp. abscessus]